MNFVQIPMILTRLLKVKGKSIIIILKYICNRIFICAVTVIDPIKSSAELAVTVTLFAKVITPVEVASTVALVPVTTRVPTFCVCWVVQSRVLLPMYKMPEIVDAEINCKPNMLHQ
jgi:hypothetical protein